MSKHIIKLDEKDIMLLDLLQNNCRVSINNLAKKIGIAPSTLYQRINRLKKYGVIKCCRAVLNAEKLGVNITSFIMVTFYKPYREIRDILLYELCKYSEVQEIHILCTGKWDAIAKVKVKGINELRILIYNLAENVKVFSRLIVYIVVETIKESSNLPLTSC